MKPYIKGEMMRKILVTALAGFGLAACGEGDDIKSPMELVKTTTLKDTFDYCMNVNGNRAYCDCELEDLERTFPWDTYMMMIDAAAGQQNHVAAVIEKHNGSGRKVLEELNCKGCVLETALVAVDASPSPRCAALLD
jgi:hypothetical protein